MADNNARFGFTFQKLICDTYNIIPNSTKAINNFEAAYDNSLKPQMLKAIKELFKNIGLKPVECTTFDETDDGKKITYNFLLENNSTLSLRTTVNGDKVAPRVVGQAGYEVLNQYFGKIYGKQIKDQDDIKLLFVNKVEEVLPIFFEKFIDADYVVWVDFSQDNTKSHLIKGDSEVDMEFVHGNFSFTKGYEVWNESSTLKYKGKSIAEIQIHKNRTFKFRFIMSKAIEHFQSASNNNETLGITAEKVICDMYNLEYPPSFFTRYSETMQYQIQDSIQNAFMYLPRPIAHTGSERGERGGQSKCSYDFVLYGNKTLSVKTNIGKMVCPPEVGQPNDKTCYKYFKDYVDGDKIDKVSFKHMIFNHIEKLLPIYLEHMFDSDYLLRIFVDKEEFRRTGNLYNFQIVEKNKGKNFVWKRELITFSKPTIEDWNESNSIYYDGIKVAETQVHNNRNCYKFRFEFNNLLKILNRK